MMTQLRHLDLSPLPFVGAGRSLSSSVPGNGCHAAKTAWQGYGAGVMAKMEQASA